MDLQGFQTTTDVCLRLSQTGHWKRERTSDRAFRERLRSRFMTGYY